LEVCSGIDSEPNEYPARTKNDATCLAWVKGFEDGFTVHDELPDVPEKDRMVCASRGVTALQIIRVFKKYIAENPDKAHRATRYVASLALADTFPCKTRK
jgi:hypothetical protein